MNWTVPLSGVLLRSILQKICQTLYPLLMLYLIPAVSPNPQSNVILDAQPLGTNQQLQGTAGVLWFSFLPSEWFNHWLTTEQDSSQSKCVNSLEGHSLNLAQWHRNMDLDSDTAPIQVLYAGIEYQSLHMYDSNIFSKHILICSRAWTIRNSAPHNSTPISEPTWWIAFGPWIYRSS